jgi:hypothetical protein
MFSPTCSCRFLQKEAQAQTALIPTPPPESEIKRCPGFRCRPANRVFPTCRGAWPLHIECCLSVLGEAVSGNKLIITNRSRA